MISRLVCTILCVFQSTFKQKCQTFNGSSFLSRKKSPWDLGIFNGLFFRHILWCFIDQTINRLREKNISRWIDNETSCYLQHQSQLYIGGDDDRNVTLCVIIFSMQFNIRQQNIRLTMFLRGQQLRVNVLAKKASILVYYYAVFMMVYFRLLWIQFQAR